MHPALNTITAEPEAVGVLSRALIVLANGIPNFLGTLLGIWLAAHLAFKSWTRQKILEQRHEIAFRYTKAMLTIRVNMPAVRNPLMKLSDGY